MSEFDLKKKEYRVILLVLLLSTGLIIFKQMRPYFGGFLGAFTLYIVLRRQMKYLVEKKGWSKGLSATLLLIEALLFFLLPITGIGAIVVDRLSGINIDFDTLKLSFSKFINNIETRFGFDFGDFDFLSFLPKLGTDIVQILASNSYSFVINLFVIIFVLYFMLFSYKDFEIMIREILPFSKQNKITFIKETKSIIKANAIGIPLLALVQGSFAYIGYLLFGVSSPVLYAILTAFATILPIVGTAIIYVPLSIALFLDTKYGLALGLLVYGIVIIGSVDNIVRFLLQKKLADIHPLITVFGVLIGLPLFGFWGVIFGPLILSLFMLFFNMYRYDFIEGTVAQPHITTDFKKRDYNKIRSIKLPKKKNKQTPNLTDE
ncbi:MAG: AI-2E family transporter [Porphyromonadaceae bacterium]|jgi:predicted PurR-regulated permease PerM|nr:AI-2E family transporter [Porphyromonadaceae bacterium]